MEELNQLLQAEIDPNHKEDKLQAKQRKGFTTTGIKKVKYIGNNLISVQDAGGGSDYMMEYINFMDICKCFDFKERSLKLSGQGILCEDFYIFDFDKFKIFKWDPTPVYKPMGGAITHIKENYDSDIGRVFGDAPEDTQGWQQFLYNKTL